jgi:hypothetical protein
VPEDVGFSTCQLETFKTAVISVVNAHLSDLLYAVTDPPPNSPVKKQLPVTLQVEPVAPVEVSTSVILGVMLGVGEGPSMHPEGSVHPPPQLQHISLD